MEDEIIESGVEAEVTTEESSNTDSDHGDQRTKDKPEFPYYVPNPDDWTRAQIDLTPFGYGVFTIEEPTMSDLRKAENVAGNATKQKGDDDARASAANLRAFISAHEFFKAEDSGKNVRQALPKRTADFKAWESWYATLPQKIAARLHISVRLFNQDYGVKLGKN